MYAALPPGAPTHQTSITPPSIAPRASQAKGTKVPMAVMLSPAPSRVKAAARLPDPTVTVMAPPLSLRRPLATDSPFTGRLRDAASAYAIAYVASYVGPTPDA